MAIRNWREHRLDMDFSGLFADGKGQPSDIDMFYIGKNRTLVIGEIKNSRGSLKDGQRRLLARLCDDWKHDAICLYITHDKFVQHGDRSVDIANCYVEEYYYKGKWRRPERPTTAKMALDRFR